MNEPGAPVTTAKATRVILFAAIGLGVNLTTLFFATFSIMLKPMTADFGDSRTGLTSGYALCVLCLAFAGPFVGRLVDRYGQRKILLAGIPLFGVALAGFAWLPTSLPIFLFYCAVLGAIGAASYQFVYFSVLSHWFDRRLGLALALAGAGVSVGFTLLPPYANWLVESFGWQTAYLCLGLTSMAIALPNLLLYPGRPVDPVDKQAAASPLVPAGVTLPQALRSGAFWKLALSYFLLCAMVNGNMLHFVPLVTDRGIDRGVAAAILGLVGIANLSGRLGCGLLLNSFGGARVGSSIFALGVVGAVLLISAHDRMTITIAVMLIGIALGSEGELLNFMALRTFGLKAHGAILGALSAGFLAGILTGPMLMSVSHDGTGNYFTGQVILVVAGLAAALLHWSVRPPSAVRDDRSGAASPAFH